MSVVDKLINAMRFNDEEDYDEEEYADNAEESEYEGESEETEE